MLNFGNKEFRNLEEQVLKNQHDIESIKTGVVVYKKVEYSDLDNYKTSEYLGKFLLSENNDEQHLYTVTKEDPGDTIIIADLGIWPAKGDTGPIGPTGPVGPEGKSIIGPRGYQGIQGAPGRGIDSISRIDSTNYEATFNTVDTGLVTVETSADVHFGAGVAKKIDFDFKYEVPTDYYTQDETDAVIEAAIESIPSGPAGPGVAEGGTTGQILAKKSDADYDTEWITNTVTHGIPAGGNTGQVLCKLSAADYNTSWRSTHEVPNGGSIGQVLTKTGNADQAINWESIHQVPSGGNQGQVLAKSSNSDYALTWVDQSGGGGGGGSGINQNLLINSYFGFPGSWNDNFPLPFACTGTGTASHYNYNTTAANAGIYSLDNWYLASRGSNSSWAYLNYDSTNHYYQLHSINKNGIVSLSQFYELRYPYINAQTFTFTVCFANNGDELIKSVTGTSLMGAPGIEEVKLNETIVNSTMTISLWETDAGYLECRITHRSFSAEQKSLPILWAKLELGSESTPYVIPNPTEEIYKCAFYRQWIGGASFMNYANYQHQYFQYFSNYVGMPKISLPTMRKATPTTSGSLTISFNTGNLDAPIKVDKVYGSGGSTITWTNEHGYLRFSSTSGVNNGWDSYIANANSSGITLDCNLYPSIVQEDPFFPINPQV